MPKTKPEVVAILCADLHLTLQAPACRRETNWLEVQAKYFGQVDELSGEHGVFVLCAGDIFDRWNPVPELLNFALQTLPKNMICVPGQHDLPNHLISQMHRSGYGVLVEAGRIQHIPIGTSRSFINRIRVHGFPWGAKLEPREPTNNGELNIALVHRYVWDSGYSYPGAPETAFVGNLKGLLKGYDVAVFGDNHKHFQRRVQKTNVWNCGGFMRRKSDEVSYSPRLGVLFSDGSIQPHFLDTTEDQLVPVAKGEERELVDMKRFISDLEGLGEHGLDFRAAVENYMRSHELTAGAQELLQSCLDEK